ncbi:MAG: DUF2079 domain-containing protein [Candidatus Omnitrophota bacterium]|nr:DUF2079 domain-containing protein [Candidatus Omnitrophota bacterium]
MKLIEEFCEKFADYLIWIFIFIYVFIFNYICFLKYNSFSYYDWDFASDVIVYWNSVHGKLLYYPFLEQIIFGAHLYLIIFLIIPIYAIFQHPLTVLFLQTIFLGIAAYPLYLLAKLKLNKTFALAVSLVYLLYPPLGYINLFETHFDAFTIFFFSFALYFFEKDDFKKFLIFIFLAISCKENVSLVILMFGIYALFKKKTKKWIFIPPLLGITWFFLSVKVIIPFFAREAKSYQEGFMFSVHFQHLGRNIFEMIKTMFTHPVLVSKFALTKRKQIYLLQLFLPTSFLGILSPLALLIALPIFMQNLLSSFTSHAMIYFQYVALLIPFIFNSTINGLARLLNFKSLRHKQLVLTGFLLIAIFSGVHLNAPQLYLGRYIKIYKIDEIAKEKDKLVRMIPKDASVIATFQFLPKLSHRHDLYSMHFISTGYKMYTKVKYESPINLEYALIDFNEPLMIGSFFPPQASDNIRNFLENGNWMVLKAIDDVVLFKKNYFKGKKICELITETDIQNIVNVNIDSKIMFLGFDIESRNIRSGDVLHLTYYWKRIKKIDEEIGFFLQFVDSNHQVVLQKVRTSGYRVYSSPNWPNDHIVKEENWVFIPTNIKHKKYSVRIGMFFLSDGKILPVLNKEKIDKMGRIIISDVLIVSDS